jgi:hypothetical protein
VAVHGHNSNEPRRPYRRLPRPQPETHASNRKCKYVERARFSRIFSQSQQSHDPSLLAARRFLRRRGCRPETEEHWLVQYSLCLLCCPRFLFWFLRHFSPTVPRPMQCRPLIVVMQSVLPFSPRPTSLRFKEEKGKYQSTPARKGINRRRRQVHPKHGTPGRLEGDAPRAAVFARALPGRQ